jgi:hypothetical protein
VTKEDLLALFVISNDVRKSPNQNLNVLIRDHDLQGLLEYVDKRLKNVSLSD